MSVSRQPVVPYNRTTNIDVSQGPSMRALGISTLAVQTTGISGQAVPKIRIEGMEYSEDLRELIRSLNPVSKVTGLAGRSQGPGSTGNHRPKAP